jgi:hypothetical protein
MKIDACRTTRANHKHQIKTRPNHRKHQSYRLANPAPGTIANHRRSDSPSDDKSTTAATSPISSHIQRQKHSLVAPALATHPLKLFWPSQAKRTVHDSCQPGYPQTVLAMPSANGSPFITHTQLPAPTLAAATQYCPAVFGGHS